MLPAGALMMALSVAGALALMFVVYGAAGVAGVGGAAHQPAGALMVVLPMVHAASLRSPLLTALRCCQLALLSVVGGAADAASWRY